MDLFKKLSILTAVLAMVFIAAGCKEDEEEESTAQSMTGSVVYDIPYYVLKGETVTLSASGIEYPEKVKYKWYVTGVYSDTLHTDKVTVRFPDSIGVFNVTCYSFFNDFYSTSTSQDVTTIDTTWNTSLYGLAKGDGIFVDPRDDRSYGYVTLGGLDWMNGNLGWTGSGVPFRKSPSTASMFGCFYTWDEALTACPEGWSLPTNSDWESLAAAVGGQPVAFSGNWQGLAHKLSANALLNDEKMWPYSPDNNHDNSAAWNAIPLGYTFASATSFSGMNEYAYWWSATEKNPAQAYYRYMWQGNDNFPMGFADKSDLRASVRCVRTHPQS